MTYRQNQSDVLPAQWVHVGISNYSKCLIYHPETESFFEILLSINWKGPPSNI